MTGFPWLRHGGDARTFCEAAIRQGILLVPGDAWASPITSESASEHRRRISTSRLQHSEHSWRNGVIVARSLARAHRICADAMGAPVLRIAVGSHRIQAVA